MGGFIVHQVDAERAYSRYVKGEPIESIAASLGVSYNGLRKRWKALGFNTARQIYGRGGVRVIPDVTALNAQIAAGLSLSQLARAHKVPVTELERVLRGEAPVSVKPEPKPKQNIPDFILDEEARDRAVRAATGR